MHLVCLKREFKVSQVGEDLADGDVTRFYDKIDETDLALGDIGSCAVVELSHREVMLFFEIALLEELNENEIGPKTAQINARVLSDSRCQISGT